MKEKSVAIWEAFCDQLKQAGGVLARNTTPDDELTQAEGLRKLVRLIRVGFEASFEYADTSMPTVYRLVTPTTIGEGETSDAHYFQSMIDGVRTFRLKGRRGDAPFIEFTTYNGKVGLHAKSEQIASLTEQDLLVDDTGNYEIILSPNRYSGNWLRTTAETSVLYIREYTHDWSKTRETTFEISRLDGADVQPAAMTVASVEQAMRRTAGYVSRSIQTWAAIVDFRRGQEPNKFFPFEQESDPDESPEMPTGHRFSSGYFRLQEHEALLIRLVPQQVPYWGLDTTNYWFEPLSYGDSRSHVNNGTAVVGKDGVITMVIATKNPGVPNWIDTRGHCEGVMLFRWSRTSLPLPELQTQVVAVDAVRR